MGQPQGDKRSLTLVAIHHIFSFLTPCLSLTGNLLVCLAFYRNRRLRTITNYYVLSLAIADIMMATLCYPFYAIASGLRRWPFNYNFCQFTEFVTQYWIQVSVFILTISSINRYFCVVKPNRYSLYFSKNKTTASVLAVWCLTFVEALLVTLFTPIIYQWSPNNLYCRATALDERTERTVYLFFGCVHIVAMIVVAFCYSKVHRFVKQHNATIAPSLEDGNSPGTIRAQEIKASRLLFAAVLGFCISNIPFVIFSMSHYGFRVSIPPSAQSIYPLLGSFSSWINPLIYGVMNRAMRREFWKIMLCRKE